MSNISTAYAQGKRVTVRNIDELYNECLNFINSTQDRISIKYRFNALFSPYEKVYTSGYGARNNAGFSDVHYTSSAALANKGFGYYCTTNGSPLIIYPYYNIHRKAAMFVVSWDRHVGFLRYLRQACDNVYTKSFSSFQVKGAKTVAYNSQTNQTYFI